jgi:hypothetical protein
MRYSFNHVVTSLVPELLGKDALLNETMAEIERRVMEEAERTSPRFARRKEVRRRGYARFRFLRGFRVFLQGRRVAYGLEWVTVSLPVMYKGEGEDEGGGGVAQGGGAGAQVPPARVGREVERQALNSGAGGEGGLQVRGRGREVSEVKGKEGGS